MKVQTLIALALIANVALAVTKGADVTCTTTCDATGCGAAPTGGAWGAGSAAAPTCAIVDCTTVTGTTGLTNNYCKSCPPAASATSIYANTAKTACVASNCAATTGLTNAICLTCNGSATGAL